VESGKSVFESFFAQVYKRDNTKRVYAEKNYVDVCYNSTVDRIRAELIGKQIWISIDESTDATGRHIANVQKQQCNLLHFINKQMYLVSRRNKRLSSVDLRNRVNSPS